MSLRLIAAVLMLLAALGLGIIAYVGLHGGTRQGPAGKPQQAAVQTESIVVAAHGLSAGTLTRDTDFQIKAIPVANVPPDAIVNGSGVIDGLRGALVRQYIDAGKPVLAGDVLRPRDRGFLAAVLRPGTRAVSVAVNAVTGVSGLIWPGDHVDVLLTQQVGGAALGQSVFTETVLKNVRVIAIDQKITQGASNGTDKNGAAPTQGIYRTVTLEVTPAGAEKIAVAQRLGPLSLSVRPATETPGPAVAANDNGAAIADANDTVAKQIRLPAAPGSDTTMFASNVSPALAAQKKPVGENMNIIQGPSRAQVHFP